MLLIFTWALAIEWLVLLRNVYIHTHTYVFMYMYTHCNRYIVQYGYLTPSCSKYVHINTMIFN